MNKIHRIVWSAARGAFIVAHELASRHGKASSVRNASSGRTTGVPPRLTFALAPLAVAVCFAALPSLSIAAPAADTLPTNGQIVGGAAAGSIATSGNAMTVTQNQGRMIANWESFSIGSAASVHFQQPTGGVALNRVTGGAPSEIFGRLSATGSVFLLNPNGVLFGQGAQVDVGSLVATTMKMEDGDFMAGNYKFTGGNGSVVSQGSLTAEQGGYVALLAPEVRNEGVITASLGQVILGAAEAVTLSHDSTGIQYAVDKGAVQALVDNKGLVQADGGQVLLSARAANELASAVINNSGTVEARGLVAQGGRIMLEANTITLASGSRLDASGVTGGGDVLVGGGWQGSGDLHQATTVTMEQGASIDASATQKGNGGTAVLWSDVHNADSRTTVAGNIKAEGAGSGNGGQIETSGHTLLVQRSARVSTLSPSGQNGDWLIDPTDFTISSGGAAQTISGMGADTLATALATGNVSITTSASGSENGDITIAADVTKSAGADATLTLRAHNSIIQNAGTNIASSSNKLNLVLWADSDATGGGYIQLGGASATTINTNGGHLWMGGGSVSTTWNGLTVGNAYAIGNSTANSNGIYLDNVTMTTGGGNIAMYGQSTSGAAVQVGDASGDTTADGIHFSSLNGSSINSGAGTILLSGKGMSTTAGTKSVGVDFANSATPVTHTLTSAATSGAAITITGDSSTATAAQVSGIWLDGVNISATGTDNVAHTSGNVVITGISGTGTDTANSKAIQQGVNADTTLASGGGDLTLIGNSLALSDSGSGNNTILSGTGTLTLQPYTSNRAVGIGDDSNAFNVPVDLFSTNMTPGFLGVTIGSTTSSSLTVGSAFTGGNYQLNLISGRSDIILNAPFNWSANTLTLSAYRHVSVNSVLNVSGTASLTVTTNSYTTDDSSGPAYVGYLKTQQGNGNFTGKIDWTSSGTLTMNGSTYAAITDQAGLASMSGSGRYFLANDIALTGTWTPITNFSGVFDGFGHTLSNLNNGASSSNDQGLFGTIAGATLQNVGITSGTITGANNVGAFVGRVSNGTNYVRNVFTAPDSAGTASVVVEPDGSAQRNYIGGIIGMLDAATLDVVDVRNGAYVHSPAGAANNITKVGGILGGAGGTGTIGITIYNSSNSGEIIGGTVANKDNTNTTLGSAVGGIVGEIGVASTSASKLLISGPTTGGYTSNSGNIYGYQYVGGIGGHVRSYVSPTPSFAYLKNTGNIKAGDGGYAGGLFGRLTVWGSNSYLEKSANKGNVTGGWIVGGLVGELSSTYMSGTQGTIRVQTSYNEGSINGYGAGGTGTGGLIGVFSNHQGNIYFLQSYNVGTITSPANTTGIGGLVGIAQIYTTYAGGATITFNQTYNAGSIIGSGTAFGHLVPTSSNNYGGDYQFYGSYYLSGVNPYTIGPWQTIDQTGLNPTQLSSAQLKDMATNASVLNSSYWMQNADINNGYPYLAQNIPTTLVTINVNDLSKTYGEGNPSLSGEYSLTGCSGCITLDWGSFLTTDTAAGSYAYSASNVLSLTYVSGSAASYAISWGGTSFTVDPRPINITADAQTKTYGAADPTLTYVVEANSSGRGIVGSDTFTGALARAAGESVSGGPYAINQGSLANSNYAITLIPANLTITPASLTVTASAQSKTYGDTLALGTTAFTSSGLQNGETIGGVTLAAAGGTAATANAGSYTITPSAATGGTFSASNYSITYDTGTLTVNPALITLTASNQSKTYGSTLNLGTTAYSITSGSLRNSDTITGVTLTSAGAVDTANVNTYGIVPSAAVGTGGFNATNYTISYGNGTLTVNRAPLTVTANNDSKTYNAVAYSGGNGVTYSGFVLGQDQSVLGGTLSYAGTAQGAVSANTYTLVPQGYTSGNYSFTYTNGTLTINRAPLTVTGAAINDKAYSGTNTATFSNYGTLSGSIYGSDAPAIITGSTTATFDSINAANGIGVTASYVVSGTGASNYQVTTPTGLTANITPKTLTVSGLVANDKTYDGTTDVTIGNWGSVTTGVGTETLTLNHGTASFADQNRANGIVVTASGYDLADGSNGGLASNYQLSSTSATTTANIAARTVTLTAGKTYDGTTDLTGYVTLGNLVSGETLDYSGALASSSHVSTANKYVSAITLIDGAGGGLAGNYQLPTLNNANAPVTINAATLTPTISNTGVTRAYNGATASGMTPTWSFAGLVSDDTAATLTYTGNDYNSKDVATANTVTVSGLTISAVTGTNGSQATDYVLDATSKTVAGTITPKTLTVSGLAASDKVYDGTTDVTIGNWGSVTTGVGTETLTLNHGTASFADQNRANGIVVTASGYGLADGSNGGLASNYQLSSTSATTTANIAALGISLAGSTGVSKTYDGRTNMPIGTDGYGSLVGVLGGNTVTITGAPVFDSANAGSRTVQQGTVGIVGSDAGNYTLNWTNGSGTIDKAPLTITANADAKFVTQADAPGFYGVSYSGFVNGEDVAALDVSGLNISRNNSGQNGAGTYAGVLVPAGATAGNYQITYANGDYTIVPANQLLVTVQNTNTTYGTGPTYTVTSARYLASDNTTIVDLTGNVIATGSGNSSIVVTDGVGGTASFVLGPVSPQTSTAAWLKAGSYAIGASSVTESSANFSNTLTVVGALTVDQKALTASATGVSKTYDGSTAIANVNLGLAGLVSGDVVSVTGNGSFSDQNAGTGKTYTVSSVALSSADAANYYLVGGDSFSGNDGVIDRKTVELSATRVYDGTNSLGAGTVTITTGVGSETLNYTGATARSKNVGPGNYIDAIALLDGSNGGLASNYQLPVMNAATSDNVVTITPKQLTTTVTAADKTFDGLTTALLTLGSLDGLVAGEDLGLSGVGNFSDANVGVDKTVLAQLTLADGSNGLTSNYTISDATTTATIRPIPQTVPPPPPSVPTIPKPPAEVPTPPPSPEPPTEVPGTPSDPSGTPGTPSDPSGTPGTPSDPSGTPGTPSDPSGTPGTPSDPSGTPGTPSDPSGNPGTPSDPSGTPGTPSDPSGTPGTSSDPNGTSGGTDGSPVIVTLVTDSENSLTTTTGAADSAGFISVRSFGTTTVPAETEFSFTLPKDTFKHADPKATIVLEARQANGKPLPAWIRFDPGAARFTGRAPRGIHQIEVSVVARDTSGHEAATRLVLLFNAASEVK